MKRRDFLKATAAGAAVTAGMHLGAGAAEGGLVPRRPYGKAGEQLSVIGFGGIVVKDVDQATADRVVADSVARGVNYFDVAPAYGDAEVQLGPALEPYRKDCFLACKTAERTREKAEADFARSCERLRTDYFDLYQLHAITDVEKDVDTGFQAGGVMDMILEKKKAGQIRYVGFSAHSLKAARTALDRYAFDSVLMPVNYAAFMKEGWGPQIFELAEEKGCAVLALKAMAKQRWGEGSSVTRGEFPKCWYEPMATREEAAMGLRWTLAQPVVSAVPPGSEKLYRLALDIAAESIKLSEAENVKLAALAEEADALFPVVEGDA